MKAKVSQRCGQVWSDIPWGIDTRMEARKKVEKAERFEDLPRWIRDAVIEAEKKAGKAQD